MKILFVASEMEPFAKVGGLADVIGTLPKRLAGLGCEVRVVIPYYRRVRAKLARLGIKPRTVSKELVFCLDWLPFRGRIKEIEYNGVHVDFLKNDEFYGRKYIYSSPAGDYGDNDLRFGFLSLGALEIAKALDFKPDIIHCHDWQTALLPICLKWRKHMKDDPFFKDSRVVFTIHNISYQGLYERNLLEKFGLPEYLFTSQGLEFYGRLNLLKGGVLYSDLVTTVSPTYASELKKSEYGYGLDPVLKWVSRNRDNLIGILNGIDYDEWDPEKDGSIYERFGPDAVEKKRLNKTALREDLGLDPEGDKPLLGVVSKLTEQKGVDLILDSIPQILDLGYQVVVVGAGVERYEQLLEKAAKRWKKNLSVTIAVNDNELERKVFAGSDMFLMPSRFEPCGLGQITALRYGAIPVVRGTGGLLDTVKDYTEDAETGNGFVFYEFSKIGMLDALLRAITLYEDKDRWRDLISRGMRLDFSWRSSGREYLRIFSELIENRQRITGNKN